MRDDRRRATATSPLQWLAAFGLAILVLAVIGYATWLIQQNSRVDQKDLKSPQAAAPPPAPPIDWQALTQDKPQAPLAFPPAEDPGAWDYKVLPTGNSIAHIAFRPDGEQMAIGGHGTYQIWNVHDGKKLYESSPVKYGGATNIVYSNATRQYLVTMGGAIKLCDADSNEVVKEFKNSAGFGDFSPNGKLLAIPMYREVLLFRLPLKTSDSALRRIPRESFSRSKVQFGTSDFLVEHFSDYAEKKQPRTFVQQISQPDNRFELTCFSIKRIAWFRLTHDRQLLYFVGGEGLFGPGFLSGLFQVGDWKSNQCVARLQFPERLWYVAVLSPDSSHVIAAQNDGKITLWDLTSGEMKGSFQALKEGDGVIHQIDISPNGNIVAVAHREEVRLYTTRFLFKER